ncbi:MAG TPA: methionyl-tRNA formyltransferase [Selenomonadales bacterium]|nr:methionyl-tRNA formyltransferase [Selenomonadales bacterium]
MTCVIVTNRTWYEHLPDMLEGITGHRFILINQKNDLTYDRLQEIRPRYVFFLHWSYIVPSEIYENFECVIFHMTDVPFGRGGSPLQNLIARGVYETKISALRCEKDIDAGPVYLKKSFSLHGAAEEIYMRAATVIQAMIAEIIMSEPQPVAQTGEPVFFPRRKPEDGAINNLTELEKIYDYIRMLDAEGYPPAYLETDNFRFEFSRAALKDGHVVADVIIKRKA